MKRYVAWLCGALLAVIVGATSSSLLAASPEFRASTMSLDSTVSDSTATLVPGTLNLDWALLSGPSTFESSSSLTLGGSQPIRPSGSVFQRSGSGSSTGGSSGDTSGDTGGNIDNDTSGDGPGGSDSGGENLATVPEPSTWVLLIGALVIVPLWRRLR